jgi:hypothetical protein
MHEQRCSGACDIGCDDCNHDKRSDGCEFDVRDDFQQLRRARRRSRPLQQRRLRGVRRGHSPLRSRRGLRTFSNRRPLLAPALTGAARDSGGPPLIISARILRLARPVQTWQRKPHAYRASRRFLVDLDRIPARRLRRRRRLRQALRQGRRR